MSVAENKEVVRRFWDEWNKGNFQGMMDLISEDAQDHAMPPGMVGNKEGIQQLIGMYHQAFPGMQSTMEDLIGEGDLVVCRLSFTGTNSGSFMGMPATGKSSTITAINIFRVANGKLMERWANQDDLGMMQQLGFIPAPEGQPA